MNIISLKKIKEGIVFQTNYECEKLIKYYTQQKYDSQEYCNTNIQNPNSKCNEDNYRNKIINICKNDILKWYKEITNSIFDFENPKTFNEKIQWMKLYDNDPLKTKLTDKYLVSEWVKEKIGE